MTLIRKSHTYLFADETGRVLYVGTSQTPARRIGDHSIKPWFSRVRRIELLPMPSLEEAQNLEVDLIHHWSPEFNQTHKPHTYRAGWSCSDWCGWNITWSGARSALGGELLPDYLIQKRYRDLTTEGVLL